MILQCSFDRCVFADDHRVAITCGFFGYTTATVQANRQPPPHAKAAIFLMLFILQTEIIDNRTLTKDP